MKTIQKMAQFIVAILGLIGVTAPTGLLSIATTDLATLEATYSGIANNVVTLAIQLFSAAQDIITLGFFLMIMLMFVNRR